MKQLSIVKYLASYLAISTVLALSLLVFSPVASTVLAQNRQEIVSQPVEVILPTHNIDLQIQPGFWNTQTQEWNIDETHAFYHQITGSFGHGKTLVYAHNRPGLFGNTIDLQPGDSLELKDSTGKNHTYKFTNAQIVDPSDTSVLADNTTKDEVVLLACYGPNSEARRLMYFSPAN